MNDKRVDGYIFWLAEYLSRKFQSSKRKQTLETAVKDANDSFTEVYLITQSNDDIATFNTIKKSDDYKRMVFFKTFYGKEYGDKESVENLIYNNKYIFCVTEFVNGAPPEYMKDGKYRFSDADEAIYSKIQKADKFIHKTFDQTLKFFGKPGDKERILEMVKSVELPDSVHHLPVNEAQRYAFFLCIADCLKPRQHPLCITAGPAKGKIFLPELVVDLSQDTDIIVSKFKKMIVDVKIMASQAHRGDGIAIGKDNSHYSFEEHVLATLNGEQTSYSPKSDRARATGLWIWDYVKEHGGSASAAVREAKKHPLISQWFSASPDRVLERHHARTRECILNGAVLLMSES